MTENAYRVFFHPLIIFMLAVGGFFLSVVINRSAYGNENDPLLYVVIILLSLVFLIYILVKFGIININLDKISPINSIIVTTLLASIIASTVTLVLINKIKEDGAVAERILLDEDFRYTVTLLTLVATLITIKYLFPNRIVFNVLLFLLVAASIVISSLGLDRAISLDLNSFTKEKSLYSITKTSLTVEYSVTLVATILILLKFVMSLDRSFFRKTQTSKKSKKTKTQTSKKSKKTKTQTSKKSKKTKTKKNKTS